MTKYWPMSVITHSPLMPASHTWELEQIYSRPLSNAAYNAVFPIVRQTAPIESGLVIIESIEAPARRVYTEYPVFEDWLRLERGGIIEANDGGLCIILDALH